MHGIDGSKREAANMIRSLVSSWKPARWIAVAVSRAGWQPPAILGQAAVVGDLEQHPLGLVGL